MQQQALMEEVELCEESYPVYCINRSVSGDPETDKVLAGPAKIEAPKTDWNSLVEEFISYQQGIGRTQSTLKRHRTSLKYFTDYLNEKGIADLAGVTPQIAAGYQAWIYGKKTRFKKPFALKSQIIVLNSVQVFFKYLLKTGQILTNPAEVIQLPREPKKIPGTILSSKEMKRLLNQPDTGTVLGFRDRTMYEVLYSTGLRISELIGIRVQDLPSTLQPLSGSELRRTGPATPEGGIFIAKSKNFKERYVPLGETACRYLQEYLQDIRPLLLRNSAISAPLREALFLSRLGRPLHKTSVFKKLQIYGRRAAIKKHLTVHVFRHTLATDMLRRGADLRQIQELLGHKNLRTTQIYTHVFKGELKRIQSHCHPREQTDLPDGFVKYRGRKYIKDDEQ